MCYGRASDSSVSFRFSNCRHDVMPPIDSFQPCRSGRQKRIAQPWRTTAVAERTEKKRRHKVGWCLVSSYDAGVLPASFDVVVSCEPPLRLTTQILRSSSRFSVRRRQPQHFGCSNFPAGAPKGRRTTGILLVSR